MSERSPTSYFNTLGSMVEREWFATTPSVGCSPSSRAWSKPGVIAAAVLACGATAMIVELRRSLRPREGHRAWRVRGGAGRWGAGRHWRRSVRPRPGPRPTRLRGAPTALRASARGAHARARSVRQRHLRLRGASSASTASERRQRYTRGLGRRRSARSTAATATAAMSTTDLAHRVAPRPRRTALIAALCALVGALVGATIITGLRPERRPLGARANPRSVFDPTAPIGFR